jgi:hypothetical protein
MRLRVQRAPTRSTIDHNTGRGTAAFNEREAALENKAVKDHEAATLARMREEAKSGKTKEAKPVKTPRNSGLKTAAATGSSAEIESIQKQIDALQAQLNKIKK